MMLGGPFVGSNVCVIGGWLGSGSEHEKCRHDGEVESFPCFWLVVVVRGFALLMGRIGVACWGGGGMMSRQVSLPSLVVFQRDMEGFMHEYRSGIWGSDGSRYP